MIMMDDEFGQPEIGKKLRRTLEAEGVPENLTLEERVEKKKVRLHASESELD